MIKQGYTYATIEKESGASTATISRVKRSLQWGNDAYTMILERLNIETKIILRLTYIYKLKCSFKIDNNLDILMGAFCFILNLYRLIVSKQLLIYLIFNK